MSISDIIAAIKFVIKFTHFAYEFVSTLHYVALLFDQFALLEHTRNIMTLVMSIIQNFF